VLLRSSAFDLFKNHELCSVIFRVTRTVEKFNLILMTDGDEQSPDEILAAQNDCVRNGWIIVHEDGRITITKKGRREIEALCPMLDQTESSLRACLTLLDDDPPPARKN
jgi:hypothetical protein